jgi:hypothetical protein
MKIEQTWPYIKDIISPTGQPTAVDVGKDAVQIVPSTVVTISQQAWDLACSMSGTTGTTDSV